MKVKNVISLLLCVVLLIGVIPTTSHAAGNNPFTDVKTTDWFYDGVQYAYEHGMMNGTGNGKFSPNETTTRAMIVTILHRLEGTPAANGTVFSDVTSGKWYSEAVSWASSKNIVNGYGNGQFGPGDTITREQMATILYRYASYKGYDVSASTSLEKYTDSTQISSYAVESMMWANVVGLITGTTSTTLSPKGSATRAQAATILMRFCENIVSIGAEEYYENHSELIDIVEVEKSDDVLTEMEVKSVLEDLGFGQELNQNGELVGGYPITYSYSINGDYKDRIDISENSTHKHPTYQTFYLSESGEGWVIDVINGEIFANPVSFNLESDMDTLFLVSTTETLTSYDDATNMFYVTIPYASEITVETVDRIDAETLDRLTIEEICRLTGATVLASANEPVAVSFSDDNYVSASVSPITKTANDDPIIVVSLGDSYSSGEGIPPFYGQEGATLAQKVKDENWLAHRSTKSWPSLLEIQDVDGTMSNYWSWIGFDSLFKRNVQWYFVASSGAETIHIAQQEQPKPYHKRIAGYANRFISGCPKLPKQIDIFENIHGTVDYVTLTIGGNDVDFAGVVTLVAQNSAYLYFGFTSELEDKLNELWNNIDSTMANIEQVYKNIEKKAGKQAAIIVAGYPKLLDKWGKGLLVNMKEAALVNAKVTAFNKKIKELVEKCRASGMNIYFVDVESEFEGHEAYSSEAWLNPIWLVPRPEDLDDTEIGSHYSVHPNEEGAKAYARCVNAKIEEIENSKKTQLVTDAYAAKITGEDGDCSFSIPKINIAGEAIEAVNQEIWDELYFGVVEEIQTNQPIGGQYINYNWAVNGDILSLCIESHPVHWAWWDYYVYNISISNRTLISKESLLNSYGLKLSEYNELVRQALYSYDYETMEDNVSRNKNSSEFITMVNEQLTHTVSAENVAEAVPFINENGQLCIVGFVYAIAGADGYFHVINLEDFKVSPRYPALFDLPAQQQDSISEEDALRIVEEKSGYYDGQTEGEEYVIHIWYVGQQIYNDRRTYAYQIRRSLKKIEGPQFTFLIETVYVDTETGEAFWETPFDISGTF